MFVVMMSRSSSNLGHMGSKTRSVCQNNEKSCLRSLAHNFDQDFMKHGQNVLRDDVYVKI